MSKTVWIIIGVVVVLLIIFAIFSSRKNRAKQEQMERETILLQNQQQQQSGNLAGTLTSAGSLLDSLTGLFGQLGVGSGGGNNNTSTDTPDGPIEPIYDPATGTWLMPGVTPPN